MLGRIKIEENRSSSPEILRNQFPLTLAWACTVHKVQGLTLSKLVFSFDLLRQRKFNFGLVYVALCRVRRLSNLFLTGDISESSVRGEPRVEIEYQRLRDSQHFEHSAASIICESNSKNFVISLLNVRSMKRHYLDIRHDVKIAKSDIIALTEACITPMENIMEIQDCLNEFQIVFQNQSNDYQSLPIYANTSRGNAVLKNTFFCKY